LYGAKTEEIKKQGGTQEASLQDTPTLGRQVGPKNDNPYFHISDFTYVNSMITNPGVSQNLARSKEVKMTPFSGTTPREP